MSAKIDRIMTNTLFLMASQQIIVKISEFVIFGSISVEILAP